MSLLLVTEINDITTRVHSKLSATVTLSNNRLDCLRDGQYVSERYNKKYVENPPLNNKQLYDFVDTNESAKDDFRFHALMSAL